MGTIRIEILQILEILVKHYYIIYRYYRVSNNNNVLMFEKVYGPSES